MEPPNVVSVLTGLLGKPSSEKLGQRAEGAEQKFDHWVWAFPGQPGVSVHVHRGAEDRVRAWIEDPGAATMERVREFRLGAKGSDTDLIKQVKVMLNRV
jgi:hypothetical protein